MSATKKALLEFPQGIEASKRLARIKVLDTDQHMDIDGTPGLELKAIEVSDYVTVQGLLAVAEDLVMPPVGVCPSKISRGDLLQDICHVQGLQHREVCRFLTLLVSNLPNEARPGKGPLAWADCQKKRWKTVLVDGIYEEQVLPCSASRLLRRICVVARSWDYSRIPVKN